MWFCEESSEKVHNRSLDISTFACGPSRILVEGRLTDTRFFESHSLAGEKRDPGIVHDLIVRMTVLLPRMMIEGIETRMVSVPNPDCRQVQDSLEPLIGETITSGFTNKVAVMVGGRQGCAHLVALVRAMASAALQGGWASLSRRPPDERAYSQNMLQAVIDSCHVWRSDGPLVQIIKAWFDTHRRNPESKR